jgi:glycosyltransferase involved in cell wall biosynthesis
MIVGRDPTPAVRALGDDARIAVTGAVPSMPEVLRGATIAAVPLRYGVGIQNKVLEAMATATPVVATPQAARALHNTAHAAIVLAETAGAFAGAVLDLLDDPARRAQMGVAGRSYVETHHNWYRGAERLVERYALAANQHLAPTPG